MTTPDRPGPATTTRVDGADWSRDDLTGRTHEHVEFVRVDLAETTSTAGLVFDGCVFRDVEFDLAEHTGAAFLNCTFTGCSFVGARFTGCKVLGSTFTRCTFDRMAVQDGDWSFSGLRGADLRAASFEGVRLREVDLSGANCTGGVLRRSDLSAATFHHATLDRCDLRGSDLAALDPWTTAVAGAVITWEQAVVLAGNLGLDVQPE